MRFENPLKTLVKQPTDLIEAYENWRETQTVADLESIRNIPNAIHMESLVIRERILGVNNPELPHPIVFRGAVFADDARFDRCISLWLHALRLRQRMQLTVSKDLLRFAQVFSQVCCNPYVQSSVGSDLKSLTDQGYRGSEVVCRGF